MLLPPQEFDVMRHGDVVQVARERVVSMVESWRLPLSADTVDDVRLCTSEVVANALQHGGGVCRVVVQWTGSHLRIDVVDFSQAVPTVGDIDTDRLRGRGMAIVKAFAATWGWEPRGAGKTVYFLFAQDQPSGAATEPVRAPVVVVG